MNTPLETPIAHATPGTFRVVAAALTAAFWMLEGCMMVADQKGPSGTVEKVSPAPGSQGIAVAEPMVIRFDMPLDRGSIGNGAVLAQRMD